MSDGLPSNVSPANPNWRPTPDQLKDWKSNYPNVLIKANSSNDDWFDLDGNVDSNRPMSPCGFAIYEWRIVSGIGEWVEIENRCSSGCNPVRPLAVPGAMPIGTQIANPCN